MPDSRESIQNTTVVSRRALLCSRGARRSSRRARRRKRLLAAYAYREPRRKLLDRLPALLFGLILLAIWALVAARLNAAYVLPGPLRVLQRLWELRGPLLTVHMPYTLMVAGIGLALSLVLGVGIALLMNVNPILERALYPSVVISQTIPTIALAPLFVVWFGYGIWAKVVVTVLMSFFPFAVTLYDGLRSAPRQMEELLLSYGAGRADLLFKIRLPYALPSFFSALKMAVPTAIVGAMIGEWLGSQSGLGYFSKRMMTQLDGAGVFAPILLSSLAAILLVSIVHLLERIFVPWRGES